MTDEAGEVREDERLEVDECTAELRFYELTVPA